MNNTFAAFASLKALLCTSQGLDLKCCFRVVPTQCPTAPTAPSSVRGRWSFVAGVCVAPPVNKGRVQPGVAPGMTVDAQRSLISAPKDRSPACLRSDAVCTWR